MDNGGTAFPQHPGEWRGMTLLDYFAAQALQGSLAAVPDYIRVVSATELAESSYDYAAAMITEKRRREK